MILIFLLFTSPASSHALNHTAWANGLRVGSRGFIRAYSLRHLAVDVRGIHSLHPVAGRIFLRGGCVNRHANGRDRPRSGPATHYFPFVALLALAFVGDRQGKYRRD